MKEKNVLIKTILVCFVVGVLNGAHTIPVYQDPVTGHGAWGAIDYFRFYDDFKVNDTLGQEIDYIETYEYYGYAPDFGDVYTIDVWNKPLDFGGEIVAGTFTHELISEGHNGPYGFPVKVIGFYLGDPDIPGDGLLLAPGKYWLSFSTGIKNGPGYYWYISNAGKPNGSNVYVDGFGYSDQWAGQNFDLSMNVISPVNIEQGSAKVLARYGGRIIDTSSNEDYFATKIFNNNQHFIINASRPRSLNKQDLVIEGEFPSVPLDNKPTKLTSLRLRAQMRGNSFDVSLELHAYNFVSGSYELLTPEAEKDHEGDTVWNHTWTQDSTSKPEEFIGSDKKMKLKAVAKFPNPPAVSRLRIDFIEWYPIFR